MRLQSSLESELERDRADGVAELAEPCELTDRTDDLRLAKPALSQLSYSPVTASWWARADLNCRPHAYQACALTT